MSLKKYIQKIEEAATMPGQAIANGQPGQQVQPGQQPMNGQQGQQPMNGQQPQQGVPPTTGAPTSTTAPAPTTATQQVQPNATGAQAQQPGQTTTQPGPNDLQLKEGEVEIQLDEAIKRIQETHPYEHKQFMEGWGMDSSLFEALAEHYHKEGKIPRAIWHGPLQELKEFVEECYAKENGIGGNEDKINSGMLDEEGMEEGIEDRIGANPTPEKDPAKQNSFNTPAYQRKQNEQGGVSSLEQRLKETDMFESKGKTEKTKTGLKHTGTYGKEYETDAEGNEKKIEKNEPKKGRGRPKKDGGESGKGFDFSALSKVSGSKKPKKEIGKVSVKHKLSDKEPVDESIAKWDAQLRTLLEGKQLNEGLSVSTSVGNEHTPDSVSITANDEDAHELLKLIQTAGLGLKKDANADLMKAHGDSSPFSVNSDDEDGEGEIEVVDFDDAQSGLEGDGDDGMAAMKQMLAAMGIGKEAAPEPKHPEGFDGSDEEEEESDEEEISADEVGSEEFGADEEGEDDSEESDDEESEDDGEEKEAVIDEGDVEEGNAFTGAKAEAEKQGKDSFKVGDKEFPVKEEEQVEEGKQTCNECGAMYEGDGHECEHGDEQLNEWANKRGGSSEDEQFTADIKFMMDVVSGGLNGKKKDQSVMPSTQVYTIDVAEEMKKLAGIK